MKIDLYTKGVLTVIALLLAMIAIKPFINPPQVVKANAALGPLGFATANGFFYIYDPAIRKIYIYNREGNSSPPISLQ